MGLFGRFALFSICFLFVFGFFDGSVEALAIFPVYRMKSLSQRPKMLNAWNLDYRFNRPRTLYQSLVKRSAMKRERILDSLGGDYLIKKRNFGF